MKQRAITAVFFAVAMIGGIYGGRMSFTLLFTAIAAGCLWELLGLLLPEEPGKKIRQAVGAALALLPWIVNNGWLDPGSPFIWTVPALLILTQLFDQSKTPFTQVGHVLVGTFYISLPLALLVNISANQTGLYLPNRVFGLLWLVWTNDTLAYLIGSRIGRHKLFPRISPNKTWEGTVGGALCTVGMAALLSVWFNDYTRPEWLALAVVVGVFGTLGDLVESMLKRSVGVKDSGALLPGHGGLLDRFDAFLFVLPFAWLVLQFLRGMSSV